MPSKTLEKQVAAIKSELKKAIASKEGARELLRQAGILTKRNQIAKPYR